MNALATARLAYSTNSAPTRTSKDVEYEALAKITHRMRSAEEKGSDGYPQLAAALYDNKRLWTIFAADVAGPENALPRDLRARLFYLAEFTDRHTSLVLARKAKIQPLLEVNTAILRGLRNGAA